jgi:hypothetical protein
VATHAVFGIDHQRLHVVAGQAARITRLVPPHAHADAVVARKPIRGGDPQVTVVVARQRLDLGRGQALAGPDDAEARPFRHRRQRAGAQQPKHDR